MIGSRLSIVFVAVLSCCSGPAAAQGQDKTAPRPDQGACIYARWQSLQLPKAGGTEPEKSLREELQAIAGACASDRNACDRIRTRRLDLMRFQTTPELLKRALDALATACQVGELLGAQQTRPTEKATGPPKPSSNSKEATNTSVCTRVLEAALAPAAKLAAELTPADMEKKLKQIKDILDAIKLPNDICSKEFSLEEERKKVLEATLKAQICAAKVDLLRTVDLWGAKPPVSREPKPRTLAITSVTYGDFDHGHTCDATIFLRDKCKLSQASKAETVDDSFCFYERAGAEAAALGTGADLCGYEPSVQATNKRIKVEFTCNGVAAKAFDAVGETKAIRLICDPFPPKAKPQESQPNIAEIKAFLQTADACKMSIQ